MIDFKAQWFFKVDSGSAFAVSFVITDEDGTVVVEKTEYQDAKSTHKLWFEKSVMLKAGTYTVEMFTLNSKKNAGEPSLMYKNPSPCGVNAWKSFSSDAQMTCDDPIDELTKDDTTDFAEVVTPTAAAAVNPYAPVGDDAADNAHPARRLLSASGGNDPVPNQKNPSSGLPVDKSYSGVMYSFHLGAKLSLEILDGLNDNYMVFSGQFRFMSFPGISLELSMIPSSGTGDAAGGVYAAFHFKINMWEILNGIIDLIVQAVIVLISMAIGAVLSVPTSSFTGTLPLGPIIASVTSAVDFIVETATSVFNSMVNTFLGLVGLDTQTIMKWMSAGGFNGDMFEFQGSIDVTPLDLGKLATFDFSTLPTATIMIKMSPHAFNNLIAMGVTLVKAIILAASAPVLMVVDGINDTLLKLKQFLQVLHNLLYDARRKLDDASWWINQRLNELNQARNNLQYAWNRYHNAYNDAHCYCGISWRACHCWGWYYLCHCGWRGCSWCYTSTCIYCPYENPSGCVGRKLSGVVRMAAALVEVGVKTALIWTAQQVLNAARATVNVAKSAVTVFLKIIAWAQNAVNQIYGFFKGLMTPLVGICRLLKTASCMVNGELTTKPLWDYLTNFGASEFTLFKIEYFQVSGTYSPDLVQRYSFKMPVVVWNVRYDLHGTFEVDPIGLLTNFFTMMWKFLMNLLGLDSAGATLSSADAAGVAGALGINHTTGARKTIYPARASAAALLGKQEVDGHVASALGVDRH